MRILRSTSLLVTLILLAEPAIADDAIRERPADRTVDGAIIAGALAASLAPMTLAPREHALWDNQLLGALDSATVEQLSPEAAQLSDLLLTAAIAAPAFYLTGSRIEDADGDRLVLYGETLAVDLALVQIAKYLIHRPRPYVYNHSPEARRYAADAGDDAWRSFYSSHAAMSFGAAVAGAYLLTASGAEGYERSLALATGFALAAATSNLRVRAGRHFYSDVLFGALVGTAVGYAVPALHADGKRYSVTGNDIAMAGAGLFVGVMISELIPLQERSPAQPQLPELPALIFDRVQLGPLAVHNGGGVAISGRVRSRWNRMPLSRH